MRFLHTADPLIIHGDLKAANVLLDTRFRAKVADFGLSHNKRYLGVTGTPFWMAPELLRGDAENNPTTDVYSFGMVVYEVYSRGDPYEGEIVEEVLMQISDATINKRPRVPSTCPSLAKSMMIECLAADSQLRPTFEELDEELRETRATDWQYQRSASKEKEPLTLKVPQNQTLLRDILPPHMVEAFKKNHPVEPERRDSATVLVLGIAGGEDLALTLSPAQTESIVDRFMSELESLATKHRVFSVETSEKVYMAVSNLVEDQGDHAVRMATFAMQVVEMANNTQIDTSNPELGCLDVRIGIHSGPILANLVGGPANKPQLCVIGETVLLAQQIEKRSFANQILCSRNAADLIEEQKHAQSPSLGTRQRGELIIKQEKISLFGLVSV